MRPASFFPRVSGWADPGPVANGFGRFLRAGGTGMICGIDPGASGALALLSDAGALLEVADAPNVKINGKERISAPLFAKLIRAWAPSRAIIELVGGIQGQAAGASFQFGYAAGVPEGVFAALNIPVTFVSPAKWKAAMRVTADKGSSRLMAQRLWPDHAGHFARVKDADRAEAALIALYGLQAEGRAAGGLA